MSVVIPIIATVLWSVAGLMIAVQTELRMRRDYDVSRWKDVLFFVLCGPLTWLALIGLSIQALAKFIVKFSTKWLED